MKKCFVLYSYIYSKNERVIGHDKWMKKLDIIWSAAQYFLDSVELCSSIQALSTPKRFHEILKTTMPLKTL